MIKRTIEVSGWGYHLAGRGKHLHVAKDGEAVGRVPFEDLGILVLDSTGLSITSAALAQTADCGGTVIVCGRDHLPVAILQPIAANALSTKRLIAQTQLSKPIKSALWARIVRAKIAGQRRLLSQDSPARARLVRLESEVKAGDRSNREGQAAKIYWRELFAARDARFRRDPESDGLNALLNYGYAILRACMARSLCAAGLHPGLGVQHSSRSNPFCLADDFLEPFRPLADAAVCRLADKGCSTIDSESKRVLLETLTADVTMKGEVGPTSVAMQKIANSYAEVVSMETDETRSGTARPKAGQRVARIPLPWLDQP